MKPIAFLDANVLVPISLCGLLLSLAEHEVIDVRWSDEVLRETRRTLVDKLHINGPSADRRIAAMRSGFGEAAVVGYEALLSEDLGCDPGDRHVLAAAISGEVDYLVTANLKHFPPAACEPYDLVAIGPDDFLTRALDWDSVGVVAAVQDEVTRRRRPPTTLREYLGRLAALVPGFANYAYKDIEDGNISRSLGLPVLVQSTIEQTPLGRGVLSIDAAFRDPLQVASLWWMAIDDPSANRTALAALTYDLEAFGDFGWLRDRFDGLSLCTGIHYAVDDEADGIAFARFIPGVDDVVQVVSGFTTTGAVVVVLVRLPDRTWRVWGIGDRFVSARTVHGG